MNVIENKDNQNNAEKINSIDIQDDNKILFFERYFIFFIISLIFSVLIKIFLDQQFIGEYNYKSRKNANYYIIITYCSSTLISIFFYILYERFLLNNEKKQNKLNQSSIELFGYLIYNKSIESENIKCCECCEDCKICCETLNRSLCCFFSCKNCFQYFFEYYQKIYFRIPYLQ